MTMQQRQFHVFYDYCNLGGVTTIFVQRLKFLHKMSPHWKFNFYFKTDLGGRAAMDALPNADVEICVAGSFVDWSLHIIAENEGDDIILVDQPEIASRLDASYPKVLYEVHTSLEQAFKRWRGADFSSVRQIICPSQWVRNRVSQLVDLGKIDIAVVPNFVDRQLFCAGGQSVELSADPVVWVGKLNSEKNVIDAIRIFQKVNSTRRISPVFVIGGGTSRDRMQQFINQLFGYGLAEQSLVLRNISNMRMASVLNGVRRRGGVYLSTSKYESFGISILEAAACGVPVVASRNGGSSEVLNHDSQESVFDGGDVNGAAEKILTLLKDPERYHLSSAQSLKVASRFKAELAVEKYHTLLSRSLPENRSQNQRH